MTLGNLFNLFIFQLPHLELRIIITPTSWVVEGIQWVVICRAVRTVPNIESAHYSAFWRCKWYPQQLPKCAKCKTKQKSQNCKPGWSGWNLSKYSIPNLGIVLNQTHLFGHMKALILRGVTQTQSFWYHLNPLSPTAQLQGRNNYYIILYIIIL